MSERIKQIRRALNMNRDEFGRRLGLSRSDVANMEAGRIHISKEVLNDIFSEFNVNENWLIEGKGDIFNKVSKEDETFEHLPVEDEYFRVATEISKNEDNFAMQALIEYWRLDDTEKKVLKNFLLNIFKETHVCRTTNKNPLYVDPELSRLDWIEEVEDESAMFTSILHSIVSGDGPSDLDISSLSCKIVRNVTTMVMLTYPEIYDGRQVTPFEIHELLNDFKEIKIYRDVFVSKFLDRCEGTELAEKTEVFQNILDVIDNDVLGTNAENVFEKLSRYRSVMNALYRLPSIV